MKEPPSIAPRARLQALLAIPERQRTDAEWDEINQLEIMLAPGNREGAPEPGVRRNINVSAGHPKPGGGGRGKNPAKKNHKRPRRGNAP
jgi:hypothetical protein